MLNTCNKAELSFEYIKEIGQAGTNSKTYLSKDHQLDAKIVIKSVEKKRLSSPTDFFNEARALYSSAHPNVVQIHYACYDRDYIYVAMPYYHKGSLKDAMTGQYLTVREIVKAGCQVLSGLHNIHSKGLIHFDVKPDNILFSERSEALLSDFGLAKQMNFSGMAQQEGFYFKMVPPEATLGTHFDLTFDIYQFGLTLYRMCNGNKAFYDQYESYGVRAAFDRIRFRTDVRNGAFPDRKAFKAHIPTRLRTVIQKCLQTDPASRYQSAIDVANAMADVEGSTLDWRLTEDSGKSTWTKNVSGTRTVFHASSTGETECFKTVGAGNARRVSEGCKPRMTDREIRTFLGSH
jgi:serine/threonine protein kinase